MSGVRADSGALRVMDVELSSPLPAVERRAGGRGYGGARVLVRLDGQPLGMVSVDLANGGVEEAQLAELIRDELGEEIDERLRSLESAPRRAEDARSRRFSVVVPTADRPDRLARCLDAILAQDHPPYEVVVADNAPGRPSTATLLRQRYGGVRWVVECRRGAAAARAAGLRAARGDFVVFVDDDVVLDRGCLTAIADAFSCEPDVGAVTTLIVPTELGTPAQRWLEQFGGFGKGYRRRVFDLDVHRAPDRLYPYSPGIYGSGACMAFRTQLLRDLGGFDLRLSVGGEDLDAFLKVILAGHRLVYEPAALAWHQHPAGYRTLQRTVFRYGVALTALMTKWVVSNPAVARDIIVRLPAALRLALAPGSRKNAGKLPDYPRRLTTLELAGMVAGPLVYAESCRKQRQGHVR